MKFEEIELNRIKINYLQPRQKFDNEKLKELAASMKEVGLVQPITVRQTKGGYEIVAGERRVKAAKMNGWKKIPAVIKEYKDDGAIAVESLIENIHRADLSLVEKYNFLKKIQQMEKIRTLKELAKRTGMASSSIESIFSYEEVANENLGPSVTQTQLQETRSLEKPLRVKLLKRAIKEGLGGRHSLRDISTAVNKAPRELKDDIVEGKISKDVVDEVIKIKPEYRADVLEQMQKLKEKKVIATPEKVQEMARNAELMEKWKMLQGSVRRDPKDYVQMVVRNLQELRTLIPENDNKQSIAVAALSDEEWVDYGESLLKSLETTLDQNLIPFYKKMKKALK